MYQVKVHESAYGGQPLKVDADYVAFVNNESYGPVTNYQLGYDGVKSVVLVNLHNVVAVEAEELA